MATPNPMTPLIEPIRFLLDQWAFQTGIKLKALFRLNLN